MIEPGLNQSEIERLRQAGLPESVINAVEAEARTMRFLWLRRLGIGFQSGIAIAFGGAFLANTFGLPDALAAVITFLLPVSVIAAGLAPSLEVQSIKSEDKGRWAARELAVLSVKANPDEGDDEWQRLVTMGQVVPPMASAAAGLNAVAAALESVSVAAQMARARAREEAENPQSQDSAQRSQPHSAPDPSTTTPAPARKSSRPTPKPRKNPAPSRADPAPARSMTPDARDRLHDAVRGAVIVAALIILLVLILVQRALGG